MTDRDPGLASEEKQRQREAEAHRKPHGQFETDHLDGAEGTDLELEKTESREPVETSLRGVEDTAPKAADSPGQQRH